MQKLIPMIYSNTLPKNKKIKRADQILPEVYGTTLNAQGPHLTNSFKLTPSQPINSLLMNDVIHVAITSDG